MQIEVFGPTREGQMVVFGVVKSHTDFLTGKLLRLRFKVSFEERNNRWHHTSFREWQDGLCKERLYAPTEDCSCIRACKEKLKK